MINPGFRGQALNPGYTGDKNDEQRRYLMELAEMKNKIQYTVDRLPP